MRRKYTRSWRQRGGLGSDGASRRDKGPGGQGPVGHVEVPSRGHCPAHGTSHWQLLPASRIDSTFRAPHVRIAALACWPGKRTFPFPTLRRDMPRRLPGLTPNLESEGLGREGGLCAYERYF